MNSYDLHGRVVADSFHPEVTYRNFDRIENSILRSPAEAPARAMSGCRKKGGSKASSVLRTRGRGGRFAVSGKGIVMKKRKKGDAEPLALD